MLARNQSIRGVPQISSSLEGARLHTAAAAVASTLHGGDLQPQLPGLVSDITAAAQNDAKVGCTLSCGMRMSQPASALCIRQGRCGQMHSAKHDLHARGCTLGSMHMLMQTGQLMLCASQVAGLSCLPMHHQETVTLAG
jgi:hypothetical protein